MKNIGQAVSLVYSFLFVLITSISAPVMSQSVTISAQLSSTELVAGDEVGITFSTTGESDVYFFSVETTYNSDKFEFTGVQGTGLTEDGLAIADNLSPEVIGASVSRTTALNEAGEGEIMTLTFTVKDKSPTGSDSFSFASHTLADSEGNSIESEAPEAAEYEVEESVSAVQLTTPGNN